MVVGIAIEAPGHQLLHYEENDNGRNIILDRQNVVTVLYVEEAPEDSQNSINYCEAAIERKLRNLSCLKFTICIPKLHDRFVVFG